MLLRIIETSKSHSSEGLHPRDCRIHCKNYFEHVRGNFETAVEAATKLASGGRQWRQPMQIILQGAASIEAVEGVIQMLEDAKALLEINSEKWFPR